MLVPCHAQKNKYYHEMHVKRVSPCKQHQFIIEMAYGYLHFPEVKDNMFHFNILS